MIIKIKGGIGNQLFQYALGIYFEEIKKYNVLYDISHFKLDNKRKFELTEAFEIDNIQLYNHKFQYRIYDKIFDKIKPKHKRFYIFERELSFDKLILNIGKNCYLDGYWHSYKYFEKVKEKLLERLKLSLDFSPDAENIYSNIIDTPNSISLHIRRGDYIGLNNVYYSLTENYYKKAIEYILDVKKFETYSLYIFSDDIEWCKKNIKFKNTIFVENNNMKSYEDLILMSICKNNIIANSSFSWWAAFLNKNIDKVVVAPKNWYVENNSSFINSLYPKEWKIL